MAVLCYTFGMRRLLALIIAVYMGGQPQAQATSFVERPFPETVQEAPVIVRGTVGASTTDWGKEGDGGRRIFTYWDLRVGEVLKGAVTAKRGELLKIREMGGEKDGMGMQVAGAANFSAAEEVVVFLSERNSENSYDVWGLMMGKLNVKTDAEGRETLSGASITGEHGDYPHASSWTMDSLRKLIATQASPAPSLTKRIAPEALPLASPTPAPPLPSASPDATPAALQLQPSQPEDQSLPSSIWIVLGALILGIAGYFIARKR